MTLFAWIIAGTAAYGALVVACLAFIAVAKRVPR